MGRFMKKIEEGKIENLKIEDKLITEGLKDLIRGNLKELVEELGNKTTYDYIIQSILSIYTKKLPYHDVLKQIEEDVANFAEYKDGKIWGDVYSLMTLISGNSTGVNIICYDPDENYEQEMKTQLTGEIYNFICENN